MKRALYLIAVAPLIFVASVAAAIGEAVFAFPEEWLRAPAPPVAYPFPDEYEFLTLGVVDHCTPCAGSGFAPDAKDLDGDPACRECGGSGEVVRVKIQKGTK